MMPISTTLSHEDGFLTEPSSYQGEDLTVIVPLATAVPHPVRIAV